MAVQNYVLLERIELNATAASVTFSNIPQSGYTDLKIVLSARTDAGSGGYQTYVRFNGDTASNYSWRNLLGTGSAAVSQNSSPDTGMRITMSDSSGDTASTFGNSELYIPNYTSSTAKSVSADGVSENNATAATTDLAAGLWTGTAAITSVTIFASGANLVSGSTFSLYGIANSNTTPVVAPKATGGNVIATDGTYWYHAFLTNGTFIPSLAINADVLVIAGGGSGGTDSRRGGGGGAGGLQAFTGQSLTATGYTCTIGAGGAGATYPAANGVATNSQFGALTAAVAGGRGGADSWGTKAGGTGGSGGGGGTTNGVSSNAGGSGTSGQGNAGGASTSTGGDGAGGGGGAAAAGGNGSGNVGGNGGAGSSAYSSWGLATNTGQNVSGTVYFAGGGGGGFVTAGGGNGGNGGGSAGNSAANATANTGGGSGGGGASGITGNGGSGIIIVRYTVA